MNLTIYGDFNCPFSALASARADLLHASGGHQIEWRAIQHDMTIPPAGELVTDEIAIALASEIAAIEDLTESVLRLELTAPSVRSNTALASSAFASAGADADRLRGRLFAAVWAEGRNVSDLAELRLLGAGGRDDELARRWQDLFDALPRPTTPTLVLSDGEVLQGLDALARLADLVAADATS